ncbi:ER-golgi trafficking TRAPP I complex 85 kDa subunit-domain-containing protein [Amylostereum chailletii]|nr:ER-golgi trafficking TRAPP I complex 85 kDa subunit-domain-containing protein [Amylostereum chailletii]
MTANLPPSLSPHICILPSQDLRDLLDSASLPPLPQILQSFSPLPQVTTRTTNLTPVSHPAFALRFSDLGEIEHNCREDEEQRAGRSIDWISARISHRSSKWLEDWERAGAAASEREGNATLKTPWWEELRHCVEGDHVPDRTEGWNHPVAIILAVSTLAPNPLQALAQLHTRSPEFPAWVDSTYMRYSLIVHPHDSPLSDEEAGALFNAVKKQYGLHSFLLPLALPQPTPPPVPIPMLPPRLPRMPVTTSNTPDPSAADTKPVTLSGLDALNTICMSEADIQQTARFVREFVAMSLVPWMEKCVVEWNENFSSSRRLPSRLFSSTRRFFGSASPSPTPTAIPTSTLARGHSVTGSISSVASFSGLVSSFPQQRRLAEFATILGDIKLAVSVWESTRKDGKVGSEILPMLLAPSPAIPLHATHALSTIGQSTTDLSAVKQLRALSYAVRWETAIDQTDFLSDTLEGERWLAEEPPLAILVAHAAYLSVRKKALRRAGLWYLFAANRLEKSGIKPLTMHFLRRAHELYKATPEKPLSPSFWEAEDVDPSTRPRFDEILLGIEHSLGVSIFFIWTGRLHYTTGDVHGAVTFFLSQLRGSYARNLAVVPQSTGVNDDSISLSYDKRLLDDFRVAFQHFTETAQSSVNFGLFQLPATFCDVHKTRIRVQGDSIGGDSDTWDSREDTWRSFWKSQGKETLQTGGKAAVNEVFWIDLVIHNPFDVDVNLCNLTAVVRESQDRDAHESSDVVDVEVLSDVLLGAGETYTIPLTVRASRPGALYVTSVTYDFLALLRVSEPLWIRGRRLQDTPSQRQSKVYAPGVFTKVEVEDAGQRLGVSFVEDGRLVIEHGECRRMRLWLSNNGSESIDEIWLVAGSDDELWIDDEKEGPTITDVIPSAVETYRSNNSLVPTKPHRLKLENMCGLSLPSGENTGFSIIVHAGQTGEQELCFLFVFRRSDQSTFHSTRVARSYEVEPLLSVQMEHRPSHGLDSTFRIDVGVRNISSSTAVTVTHLMTMSPTWSCVAASPPKLGALLPNQNVSLTLDASYGTESSGTIQFVLGKLKSVLFGDTVEETFPPPIDLLCNHSSTFSLFRPDICSLVHQARRNTVSQYLLEKHPYIPTHLHPFIFPLYHPNALHTVIEWAIPDEERSGYLTVSGPLLGASHGSLNGIIQEMEERKVTRSMYAETQRERSSILEAIRNSEWNAEMNPVYAVVQTPGVVENDFSLTPCQVPVPFTLHNYSFTHSAQYTLKLVSFEPSGENLFDRTSPSWVGRLTFRGTILPLQYVTLKPQLHIQHPDTYSLDGWTLEVEVENSLQGHHRSRYLSGPADSDQACITAVDVS